MFGVNCTILYLVPYSLLYHMTYYTLHIRCNLLYLNYIYTILYTIHYIYLNSTEARVVPQVGAVDDQAVGRSEGEQPETGFGHSTNGQSVGQNYDLLLRML